MKKLFTLIMVIFLTWSSFAQSPEKMSYQCVVRNASGVLVTNLGVGIRISILQGTATGTVIYQEIYNPNPQTNANGLVTIEIGGGTPITGTFSAINWASGPYFLKTETDPTGGTNYTIVGTSQLLSVPYALNAKTAGTADYNNLTNLPTLNISNWNTAFGWGNHAGLYRSISYVPSWNDITGKPTSVAGYGIINAMTTSHPANGITSGNITNWNTTYGWGNHAGLYRPISYVPAWADVTGKPSFSGVATSGSYTDLNNKPILFSGSYNDLTNKPTLFDGTWTSLTGKPTFTTVATSGNYNDLSNKPVIDGSETKISSGQNIIITGIGTAGNPYNISTKTFIVGDYAMGGIVFWVDETKLHGLVCSKINLNLQIWGAGVKIGLTGDGTYAGIMNTYAIFFINNVSACAASVCMNYQPIEGTAMYGDWYLPSLWELNQIYLNRSAINSTASAHGGDNLAPSLYWTSCESTVDNAMRINFSDGSSSSNSKAGSCWVRAVRAF